MRSSGGRVILDGAAVKARRRDLGITQTELAERSGLTRRTVQAAESGAAILLTSSKLLSVALGLPHVSLIRVPFETIQERLAQKGFAPVAPPTPWAERRSEVGRLLDHFTASRVCETCCISGPTGIGKTALARYAVAKLASRFEGGVVWLSAPLATGAGDPTAAQLGIAEALGFRQRLPQPHVVQIDEFDAAFRRQLWSQPRLLVLDDIPDARMLSRFLADAESAWLLATTSHRTVAEMLSGLTIELGPLSEESALGLLEAYLGDRRLAEDREGAAKLAELLGRVPRSLQIAGRVLTRERYTQLDDYARRVAGDLEEPRDECSAWFDGDRDASFTTAYIQLKARLSAASWNAFGALSALEGLPFDLEWAAAVTGLSSTEMRRHLGDLVEVYLVQEQATVGESRVQDETQAPRTRFQLDAQAQRAAGWLAGEGRRDALMRLLQHAREKARALVFEPPDSVLRAFDASAEIWRFVLNVLSGLRRVTWSSAISPTSDSDVETVLGQDGGLLELLFGFRHVFLSRPILEGPAWLGAGLERARLMANPALGARLAHLLGMWWFLHGLEPLKGLPFCSDAAETMLAERCYGEALSPMLWSAVAVFAAGLIEDGIERFERTVSVAKANRLPKFQRACALNALAVSVTHTNDRDEDWARAKTLLEEALDFEARSDVERLVRSACVVNLAMVQAAQEVEFDKTGLRDALDVLTRVVEDDDLEVWRLGELAQYVGCDGWSEAHSPPCQRPQEMFLTVPPDLLPRRLYRIGEFAHYLMKEIPGHQGVARWPGYASRNTGISAFLIGSPWSFRLALPLGLLFPLEPVSNLLDEDGLTYAHRLVVHVHGRSHRSDVMLREFARSRGVNLEA